MTRPEYPLGLNTDGGDPIDPPLRLVRPPLHSGQDSEAGVSVLAVTPARSRAVFGLRPRQLEVVLLASEGLMNREIAARLGITTKTVEQHIQAAMRVTDTRGRAELAVAVALRLHHYLSLTLAPSGHSATCGCSVCFIRSRRSRRGDAA